MINLGSNDFSTEPHPSREEFAAAYTRILRTLRDAYGDTPPILCVAPRVGAHPNYTGQRKLAMLLIPYVSTLTGWEAEAKPIE